MPEDIASRLDRSAASFQDRGYNDTADMLIAARDEIIALRKAVQDSKPRIEEMRRTPQVIAQLAAEPVAIPILLWCPECSARHIDEGEFATKKHHTHACQSCGHVWRPAIGPTCGVQFLPGFKNEPPPKIQIFDRGRSVERSPCAVCGDGMLGMGYQCNGCGRVG